MTHNLNVNSMRGITHTHTHTGEVVRDSSYPRIFLKNHGNRARKCLLCDEMVGTRSGWRLRLLQIWTLVRKLN